jgi:hypothetical protein
MPEQPSPFEREMLEALERLNRSTVFLAVVNIILAVVVLCAAALLVFLALAVPTLGLRG